ncbi:hypothetical protein INR49_008864 [Caranx melampygus]|nr:hypothetical protein INR49_008864 [Caranx melampygus]
MWIMMKMMVKMRMVLVSRESPKINSNMFRSSGSELQEIMRRRQEKLAATTCDSGVESFDEGTAH